MRATTSRRWKPILVVCFIALFVVPAAASAHMQWADEPTGFYADITATAVPQQTAQRVENGPRAPAPVPSAVQAVRTVKVATSDNTLALALSAAALGIALCGTAYMLFRLSPRMVRARRPTAEA